MALGGEQIDDFVNLILQKFGQRGRNGGRIFPVAAAKVQYTPRVVFSVATFKKIAMRPSNFCNVRKVKIALNDNFQPVWTVPPIHRLRQHVDRKE